MGTIFTIKADKLKGLEEHLLKSRLTSSKKKELLESIGTVVVFQTKERFKTKTAPDGKRWKSWSNKYSLKRANGKSLLVDEGYLNQSITYNVRENKLEVGSNEIYAGTHQYGNKNKNIPARPYLGINAEDKKEIESELIDYLKEELGL